jgi:hypothetical protein
MSKETYMRGFCKAAAAHGVDPEKLAKFAQYENLGALGQDVINSAVEALVPSNVLHAVNRGVASAAGSVARPAAKVVGSMKSKGYVLPEKARRLWEAFKRIRKVDPVAARRAATARGQEALDRLVDKHISDDTVKGIEELPKAITHMPVRK